MAILTQAETFTAVFATPVASALAEIQDFTIDQVAVFVNTAPHRGPGSKGMAQLTINWHYNPTAFTVGQQSLIDFRLTNDTDVVDSSHSCRVNFLTCSTKFDSLSLGSMYHLGAFLDDGTSLGNYSDPIPIPADIDDIPPTKYSSTHVLSFYAPNFNPSPPSDVPTVILTPTPTTILTYADATPIPSSMETITITNAGEPQHTLNATSNTTQKSVNKPAIIGGVVGGIVALLVILILYCQCRGYYRQRIREAPLDDQIVVSEDVSKRRYSRLWSTVSDSGVTDKAVVNGK
ncbi:hypothetical protein VNI00_015616 [Paramarasmius palmivorus]|uniref:Mid2 domain-containing protein n=1 Tax=Paramarasmius palmivorus TaxID=297713 RepID=A0AAW0BL21_9AGAR